MQYNHGKPPTKRRRLTIVKRPTSGCQVEGVGSHIQAPSDSTTSKLENRLSTPAKLEIVTTPLPVEGESRSGTPAPKRKRVSLQELRELECKWRAQQTAIGILHNKCHEWRSKCERSDESSQAALETKIEANMSAGTASPIKTQKQIFIVGTKKHRMKVQQENEALNEALSKVVGTLMCCGSIRKKILKKQVKV